MSEIKKIIPTLKIYICVNFVLKHIKKERNSYIKFLFLNKINNFKHFIFSACDTISLAGLKDFGGISFGKDIHSNWVTGSKLPNSNQ